MKNIALVSIASLSLALVPTPRSAIAGAGVPYRVHALVNARVVTAPGESLSSATIVVRDGVIEAIGADTVPPADARIWDLAGKTVYPGFIDAYLEASSLGKKKAEDKAKGRRDEGPRETPRAPGNSPALASVRPDHAVAHNLSQPTRKSVEKLRGLGFVAARVVPDGGIFRGQSAVISLGDRPVGELLLRESAGAVVALDWQRSEYPDSLMGVLALIRQTLSDARWYQRAHAEYRARSTGRERPPSDRGLAALQALIAGDEPLVVDGKDDPLNVLRIGRLAAAHDVDYQVLASGQEYQRIEEIAALGVSLILPLDFPPPPKVGDDPDEWTLVSTEDLLDWKHAPANPRWLADAGVTFALTTARLKDPTKFIDKLRTAIEDGLDRDIALAALTTVPARLLGVEATIGSIAVGKIASFVVTDGELFAEKTNVTAVWVDGARHQTQPPPKKAPVDVTGAWFLRLLSTDRGPIEAALEIERKGGDYTATMQKLSGEGAGISVDVDCLEVAGDQLLLGMERDLLVLDITEDALVGDGDTFSLGYVAVVAERLETRDAPQRARSRTPRRPPEPPGGPLATPRAVIVRGATIWTQGPAGILHDADLLVVDGKVRAVGVDVDAPNGAIEINGRDMHVTPGLVDAHSHTAITGGVNEGTRAVTAEVRIGDVVASRDWNLYSQLAGGLTTALLLHGSANPIGGQSQTIKLRWGASPDGLLFEGAKPGIKFALGENVKQSNWGDKYTTRYPQSRLGVQQAMRERFLAARDYLRKWAEYNSGPRTLTGARMPRKDYQLETIAEIIRGERLIHCHSYRQDEILMLIRLMEEFDVTIGTFQHVLEGYKVANELASMGAGASTFSDWWAYKFEVYDAIPFNGALMWDRGVVVSFNSDSNELARRMNTEATKAVKYGGVPEVEALSFVTLNPAKQLRIDHRVGSLEAGKDGDFVVWNGHPLDTYTRAVETWVDGHKYFDRDVDIGRRAKIAAERKKLVEAAKKAGEKAGKKGKRSKRGKRAGEAS